MSSMSMLLLAFPQYTFFLFHSFCELYTFGTSCYWSGQQLAFDPSRRCLPCADFFQFQSSYSSFNSNKSGSHKGPCYKTNIPSTCSYSYASYAAMPPGSTSAHSCCCTQTFTKLYFYICIFTFKFNYFYCSSKFWSSFCKGKNFN